MSKLSCHAHDLPKEVPHGFAWKWGKRIPIEVGYYWGTNIHQAGAT